MLETVADTDFVSVDNKKNASVAVARNIDHNYEKLKIPFNKTWKDGTPVTKYFSRGGFKDVKLKGEYQLVDSDRGWWYIQGPAGDWFAVKHDDYGTPPFEF